MKYLPLFPSQKNNDKGEVIDTGIFYRFDRGNQSPYYKNIVSLGRCGRHNVL